MTSFSARITPRGFAIFGLLSLGVLMLHPAPAFALFGRGKDQPEPRNFLPPVAAINPKIEPEEAFHEDEPEVITLSAITAPSHTLKTRPAITRLDNDLNITPGNEEYQALLDLQRNLDEEDLKTLWDATVEKNPVIRFSLEKLSTPEELQSKISSQFMRKTMNVLISGATMAATALPGPAGAANSYYRNMGAMAAGDATRSVLLGAPTVNPNILSATEKIQLAGLIDELQANLIQTYHSYKSSLQALANAHETTVANNRRYSQAMSGHNSTAVLAAGTAYYKALMDETQLRQKAKLHRLQLERLAGQDAVENLKLSAAHTQDLVEQAGGEAIGGNTPPSPVNASAAPPDKSAPPEPASSGSLTLIPEPIDDDRIME